MEGLALHAENLRLLQHCGNGGTGGHAWLCVESVTLLADILGCSNILATVALGFCMALYGWRELKKYLEDQVAACWQEPCASVRNSRPAQSKT